MRPCSQSPSSPKKGWSRRCERLIPSRLRRCYCSSFSAATPTAQEARDWLERMNRAVEELNYRGTFVHVHDGTLEMETLHIVHRNADGQSGERIVSVDGAGREFVRQGASVQGIFPDRRVVLFETRSDVSPLVSALPSNPAELEPHYEITLGGSARVADRAGAGARDQAARRVPLRLHAVARPRDRDAAAIGAHRRAGRGRRADLVHGDRDSRPTFPRPRSSRRSTRRASRRCARPSPSPRRSRPRFRGARRPFRAASSSRSRRRARSQAPTLPSSISSTPTVSPRCRCSSRTRDEGRGP